MVERHEKRSYTRKNRLLSVLLLVVLTGGYWTCGCSDDTTAYNTDTSPSRQEPPYDWADPELAVRLKEAVEDWTEDFGLYGAAAVVWTPGWFDWSGSTGVKNLDTMEPYEIDTPGRIASITKSFTATVILQLVDEGSLTLDTPLDEFVPEYPNGENITVEHLLRHRSGIPEIHNFDGFFLASLVLRPRRWVTPEEILKWTYLPIPILHIYREELVPRVPIAVPGGAFHYCQSGYIALGLIIEEVTGGILADVYDARIFRPLGMRETYLPRQGDPFDPWGYTNLIGLIDQKFPSKYLGGSANWLNSSGWSAAAIISTARELVIFLSGMLEGRLLSREGLAKATDWMAMDPGNAVGSRDYGMGLLRIQYDGFSTVGHTGSLPGSLATMQYIPELDVYIGAVTNSDRDYVGAPGLVERVTWALLNEYPG